MKFAAPRRAHKGKSERRRNHNKPPRRGFFIDVHTFAAALLSRSFTLERLSKFLNVAHPKMATDEHGGPITTEYLDYATRDVQTTWECYRELERRFAEFGLNETAPHKVFSEASIGKGYLTAMRVKPLSKVQPMFRPASSQSNLNPIRPAVDRRLASGGKFDRWSCAISFRCIRRWRRYCDFGRL